MGNVNANDNRGGLRPALPSRCQVAVHEALHAAFAHRQGIGGSRVPVEGMVAVEDGAPHAGDFGRCH